MSRLSRSAWLAIATLCSLTMSSLSAPAAALDLVSSPMSVVSVTGALPFNLAEVLSDATVLSGTTLDDSKQPVDASPAEVQDNLAALIAARLAAEPADREQECLATAVYFEAKSESIEGQLAVAQVVLNRTTSGRFPETACSVVLQRSQFGFVRRGALPAVPRAAAAWKRAVAIAAIAMGDLWKPIAPRSLYFHAARVSPRWGNAVRVATIGNHIFYR